MPLVRVSNGGSLSETVLWTNSSQSTSVGQQTVTLSDDMNNYDYIDVTFNYSRTNTNQAGRVRVAVSDLKNTGVNKGIVGFGIMTSSYRYNRSFNYSSDTKIVISTCTRSDGTTTTENAIPRAIYGIK